jgi:hypothetical protein
MASIETFERTGFDTEIGGGGVEFLSRYSAGGAYVWITGRWLRHAEHR